MGMSSLEDFQRVNTRRASIVHVGGFRPTGDPLATHFCLTPVALPGETWPIHDGKPMLFVCQLNLTEAPVVPKLLQDIAVITFFLDPDVGLRDDTNGKDWCLRAYKTTNELALLAPPTDAPKIERGFECRWEECDDQPVYDDPELIVPEGFDRSDVHLDNVRRTKVGGYASNIQSEPWWGYRRHPADPRYCLQIDSEDKVGLVWGDSGTIYLARGTVSGSEDDWFLDWQCY